MQENTNITNELKVVNKAIARLRANIMAMVFAMTGGVILFLATAWLVIKGGPNTGQHLALLGNYYIGYTVTWTGALVGFLYGALTGGIVGWLLAWIYNRIVDLNSRNN